MPRYPSRRTLSLESLESRITPALLGLTLPAPLAELTSQIGLASPVLSLAPPSQGQPGLGLGVDVGILSLHAGVGSGGSLLSLGGKVDPPLVSPLAVQTTIGSPQGPLSVGVDPGNVLPPVNVTTGSVPVVSALPSPAAPPVSVPGVPVSGTVPLPVVALQPATTGGNSEVTGATGVVENVSAPDLGVTGLAGPAAARSDSSVTLHSPQFNDQTFASLSALRAQPNADDPARAEPSDDLEDEQFSLRDGNLLEDFGAAAGAGDAAPTSDGADDASPAENASAVPPWLVGLFVGSVAGSLWLPRRRGQEAAAPVDVSPCLPPLE